MEMLRAIEEARKKEKKKAEEEGRDDRSEAIDRSAPFDSFILASRDLDEVLRLSRPSSAEVRERTVAALAGRWSRDRAEEAIKGVRSADGAGTGVKGQE